MKTTSTCFIQKDKAKKVIQTTASENDKTRASLQSNKSNTEVQNFTKIMEQNGAFIPRNEMANNARIKSLSLAHRDPSPSVNNNIVNDLKPPTRALRNGRKKNSIVNGYNCDGLPDNNEVSVIEDDDLIPPTPSPVGQHSVLSCRAQLCSSLANKMSVANQLSAANYYTSEQRETEEVEMDRTALQRCDPEVTDTGNKSLVSDLVSPACNSLGTQSTCSSGRKKYKLSRKGKLPKVLSSPLKKAKHNMCGTTAKSPKNERNVVKGTQMADQEGSTPAIAPSKCIVLRSRMKRSATKGCSPLRKRMQTKPPLPAKVFLGLNEPVHITFFFLVTENVRYM